MATIGLKIRDSTYSRLKWLKTRFEFVYESSMTWDEFFDRISRDALYILAQDLKEKGGSQLSVENLLSILSGSQPRATEDRIDDVQHAPDERNKPISKHSSI